MNLDDFLARRRELVARLGTDKADAICGPGSVEQQHEAVCTTQAQAEMLAGQIYLARLAHQGAAAEADAIRREREFRPERSVFVETAGQAGARADIRETELQRLQQRLAGLVSIADEAGLWDPSPKVLAALKRNPVRALSWVRG